MEKGTEAGVGAPLDLSTFRNAQLRGGTSIESITMSEEPIVDVSGSPALESTCVGSLRRARMFWTSLRHLGRLTDVARAPVSGHTCELRLNDIHGTNAEISPYFQMVSRSGQALGPHPYEPLK